MLARLAAFTAILYFGCCRRHFAVYLTLALISRGVPSATLLSSTPMAWSENILRCAEVRDITSYDGV
jgi:hypothetical protein